MCVKCGGPHYVNRLNEAGILESLCYPCMHKIWEQKVYGN